jgi:hypothetical protein
MTEDENGDLRALVEIKRTYRSKVASLEADSKERYERELADGRKRLKEQYLDKVVAIVFGEPAPAEVPVETKEPAPEANAEPSSMTVQYSSSQASSAEGTRIIGGYEPETVPAREKPPRCPECDAPVDPTDKFCAECAAPLEAQEVAGADAPVASTSSKFRKRQRR